MKGGNKRSGCGHVLTGVQANADGEERLRAV
jgi:hypothetical protein